MAAKHINIHKIIHAANIRGLFVMAEGNEYKFWSRKTGKWVLTYYPVGKRWLSATNGEGRADDCLKAIDAAIQIPVR